MKRRIFAVIAALLMLTTLGSCKKESGRPFAYNFSKCFPEESFDAVTQDHIDSIDGTVFVGGEE
jgi:hypothetical protein